MAVEAVGDAVAAQRQPVGRRVDRDDRLAVAHLELGGEAGAYQIGADLHEHLDIGGIDTRNGEPFAYYETTAGGMGARPGADGMSATHCHMTNSLNTPIEALEHAYPYLVRLYEIRRGSGGRGAYNGGDGIERRLRFLEEMEVVILSNHRIVPPYGVAGGEPGQCGRNWVERADGTIVTLTGQDGTTIGPEDVFVLQTPTGGGYGPPKAT